MHSKKDVSISRVTDSREYADRSIYRKDISVSGKYSYRINYKYTDIYITSDRDIYKDLEKPVKSFYRSLEKVILQNREFEKSLIPLKAEKDYPEIVKKMCRSAEIFEVGPMASVAGAVCDELARYISGSCGFLMIENGGDSYIKSSSSVTAGLYTGSKYFPKNLMISIDKNSMPCGLCSSSGIMGHSFSRGSCDLVTVMSDTAVTADAAATAVANSVRARSHVDEALKKYRDYEGIRGLVIIKDDRIAIWGDLQLSK